VERWEGAGWLLADPERIRLSPEGWLILDQLAVELDGAGVA
jgi:hypothetical protein